MMLSSNSMVASFSCISVAWSRGCNGISDSFIPRFLGEIIIVALFHPDINKKSVVDVLYAVDYYTHYYSYSKSSPKVLRFL